MTEANVLIHLFYLTIVVSKSVQNFRMLNYYYYNSPEDKTFKITMHTYIKYRMY